VRELLSLQVHPADDRKDLLPAGETGKTEAWVVLEAGTKSRIYAGLKPGTTTDDLRRAVATGVGADNVASFVPNKVTAYWCLPERFTPSATSSCSRFRRTAT